MKRKTTVADIFLMDATGHVTEKLKSKEIKSRPNYLSLGIVKRDFRRHR